MIEQTKCEHIEQTECERNKTIEQRKHKHNKARQVTKPASTATSSTSTLCVSTASPSASSRKDLQDAAWQKTHKQWVKKNRTKESHDQELSVGQSSRRVQITALNSAATVLEDVKRAVTKDNTEESEEQAVRRAEPVAHDVEFKRRPLCMLRSVSTMAVRQHRRRRHREPSPPTRPPKHIAKQRGGLPPPPPPPPPRRPAPRDERGVIIWSTKKGEVIRKPPPRPKIMPKR